MVQLLVMVATMQKAASGDAHATIKACSWLPTIHRNTAARLCTLQGSYPCQGLALPACRWHGCGWA